MLDHQCGNVFQAGFRIHRYRIGGHGLRHSNSRHFLYFIINLLRGGQRNSAVEQDEEGRHGNLSLLGHQIGLANNSLQMSFLVNHGQATDVLIKH